MMGGQQANNSTTAKNSTGVSQGIQTTVMGGQQANNSTTGKNITGGSQGNQTTGKNTTGGSQGNQTMMGGQQTNNNTTGKNITGGAQGNQTMIGGQPANNNSMMGGQQGNNTTGNSTMGGQGNQTMVTLESFMPYPGTGTRFNVNGKIIMKFTNTSVSMDYQLQNTDAKCVKSTTVDNSCGLHIHEGKTCTNATEIAGHYYDNATLRVDPWLKTMYVSDDKGKATGATTVAFGYSYALSVGRAVIVHDQNGTRMACAIIPGTGTGTGNK
jgi:hypothetical protein